jgi:hypothetical protein
VARSDAPIFVSAVVGDEPNTVCATYERAFFRVVCVRAEFEVYITTKKPTAGWRSSCCRPRQRRARRLPTRPYVALRVFCVLLSLSRHLTSAPNRQHVDAANVVRVRVRRRRTAVRRCAMRRRASRPAPPPPTLHVRFLVFVVVVVVVVVVLTLCCRIDLPCVDYLSLRVAGVAVPNSPNPYQG